MGADMDSADRKLVSNVSPDPLLILVVEDSEFDRILMGRELQKLETPYQVCFVDNEEDFLVQLEEFKPHIILCDYSVYSFGALRALEILSEKNIFTPVILVTGALTDEMAVGCLKKGAVDYVIKDKIVRLLPAIKSALETVKTKAEKKETQERLKTVTNVLPASLSYMAKDFKIQFCNQISNEWFGKDLVGMFLFDVLGEKVAQKVNSGMPTLLSGSQLSFECEQPSITSPKFVNIIIVPEMEKDSQIKAFICMITDITENKRQENALKLAKDEAVLASSAKTQFLANMSHEMRTPLNVIQGLAELLKSENSSAEDKNIWIEKIIKNSGHLKRQIDEILDISKVEAGKLEIQEGKVSVVEVIEDIRCTLISMVEKKNLKLVVEIEGSVPEFIYSDSIKLRHILLNIVGNAIKFSSHGTVRIIIKHEIREYGESLLRFDVEDRGIGIANGNAARLFEPFIQADNSMTREYGGTGLGLAIARNFARALGGDVVLAKSQIAVGSTFCITIKTGILDEIKMMTAYPYQPKVQSSDLNKQDKAYDLGGMSILLVEDSEDNQYLIQHFLKAENAQLDIASNGLEGVEKAQKNNYDLILMDVQMPLLDGINATGQLRQKGNSAPIIAFTAHAFKAEKDRCLSAGFTDFLTKPIQKSDLIKCLVKHMRQFGPVRTAR